MTKPDYFSDLNRNYVLKDSESDKSSERIPKSSCRFFENENKDSIFDKDIL